MPATLDFFFFIGSTYTYLTVQRIEALAATRGVALRWRPFSVRSIMIEQNNAPFSGKPVKMRYMWRDIERRAARHGIAFAGPPAYPVDPDQLANRVAVVATLEGWCPSFVRTTYDDWFVRHLPPGDPAALQAVLAQLGQEPARVLALADSEDIRRRHAEETDEARRAGIFGSPTFRVGQEIFWGDDRLEDALDWACGAEGRARASVHAGAPGTPHA